MLCYQNPELCPKLSEEGGARARYVSRYCGDKLPAGSDADLIRDRGKGVYKACKVPFFLFYPIY